MPIPYYNPYGQVQNPYLVYPNYTYVPQIMTAPQPQQFTNVPEAQPPRGMMISWVKSEKEVEDKFIGPNGAGAYWNENEPVIYLKKADATGKTSITIYDLVERKPEAAVPDEPKQDYATSSDLSSLVGAVNAINDNFNKEMKNFASLIGSLQTDVDTIKSDMYGIAGKKKAVKKAEGEVEDG